MENRVGNTLFLMTSWCPQYSIHADITLYVMMCCNRTEKLKENRDYFFVLQQTEYLDGKLNRINFDLLTAAYKPSSLLKPLRL